MLCVGRAGVNTRPFDVLSFLLSSMARSWDSLRMWQMVAASVWMRCGPVLIERSWHREGRIFLICCLGLSAHIHSLFPEIALPHWTWSSLPCPQNSGQAGGQGLVPGMASCSG